jgi:hypothetical protein
VVSCIDGNYRESVRGSWQREHGWHAWWREERPSTLNAVIGDGGRQQHGPGVADGERQARNRPPPWRHWTPRRPRWGGRTSRSCPHRTPNVLGALAPAADAALCAGHRRYWQLSRTLASRAPQAPLPPRQAATSSMTPGPARLPPGACAGLAVSRRPPSGAPGSSGALGASSRRSSTCPGPARAPRARSLSPPLVRQAEGRQRLAMAPPPARRWLAAPAVACLAVCSPPPRPPRPPPPPHATPLLPPAPLAPVPGWGVASSYKRTGLLEDLRVNLELMVTAGFEWCRTALRAVALLPRRDRAGSREQQQQQQRRHQQQAPHSVAAAAAAGGLPRSQSQPVGLVGAPAAPAPLPPSRGARAPTRAASRPLHPQARRPFPPNRPSPAPARPSPQPPPPL